MKIISSLLKYPKLILGAFLIVVFLLMFWFSTLFKIGILFVALFFAYKMFPPNYKKFSNFEACVLLTALFITLIFVGKGFGFLSVANVPIAIQPAVSSLEINPVILTLFFVLGIITIMYLNKRKR